ncbi:UNVERIFIED_CONTAM: Heavy metal-associated isoprenylated plant protein 26 [Sesamum indicum]
MGALDHLSHIFDCSSGHSKLKKRKQLQTSQVYMQLRYLGFFFPLVFLNQTVEIKIKIDCEGCERKVRRSVEGMKGVTSVEVSPKQNKLTVIGYVEPEKVVARVAHRTGKKAELWPYVPYDVVAHPYAPGVYDKKAPAGYVRNSEDPQVSQLARASSTEVRYTTAFSDENPAACVVM